MEKTVEERRREPRFRIQATVTVRRDSGETIAASIDDISISGMLLRAETSLPLGLGEEVTVEVEIPDNSDQPFASWGIGKVVRVADGVAAIQLGCASFGSA